jgi:N-acetylmuramoyl-L-alanine amidase
MMRVCVDPGHGGHDSGAVGPTGLQESFAALQIARYVRRGLLDCGCDVMCTRSDDKFVSLSGRCEYANDWQADLFLSIHCNAFSQPTAHGYEVWTSVGQTLADPTAEKIFASIGEAFPKLTPRFDKTDGDCDKEAGFAVLTGTRMAAVLVEVAFISNPLEERWLRNVGWKMRMGGAIVGALC